MSEKENIYPDFHQNISALAAHDKIQAIYAQMTGN